MPIDELEMMELYISIFSQDEPSSIKLGTEVSAFSPPDNVLKIEQTSLLAMNRERSNALENLADTLRDEGWPELAFAAAEISRFLTKHGAELEKYLEPKYRVLDYVYPIV